MAKITGGLSGGAKVSGAVSSVSGLSGGVSLPKVVGTSDYDKLTNKPQLNGTVLVGNRNIVLSATTEEWNCDRDMVGEKGVVYVYTDHETISDDVGNVTLVPGIKIGDGAAYLIDTPFVDAVMVQHIADAEIHVTPAEKEFWNSKSRAYLSDDDNENLVFTQR